MIKTPAMERYRPLVLPLLVVLFVATRLGIVHSTGHLFFHIDAAEYGIFRGLRLYLDTPFLDLVLDREQRFRFALGMAGVADGGLHASLILSGLLVHLAVVEWDLPMSTLTLRHLAIGVSTTGLVVWLLRLRASLGDGGAIARRVALLWLLAPVMFLKMSVLYWGTHEMVVVLYALFIGLFGGWIGRPGGLLWSGVRAAVVGGAGSVAMAANTSLILPVAFFGLWIAAEAVYTAIRNRRRGAALVLFFGMGLAGVGSFFAVWQRLCQVEALATIGLTPNIFANDKLNHIEGTASLMGPEHWFMSLRTCVTLWPMMAVAVWVLVAAWRRRRPGQGGIDLGPSPHPFVVFSATYLLVCWFAISCLPFAYSVPPNLFIERYTAHLYPVGFVLLAWGSIALPFRLGRLRLGTVALGLWLLLFLPTPLSMIDLGNLDAGRRFDGVRIYFTTFGGDTASEAPPAKWTRFGQASDSFVRGMAVLRVYQKVTYWGWRTPSEVAGMDHAGALKHLPGDFSYDMTAEDFDRADYFRGAGYGFRLVLPKGREQFLEGVWEHFPEEAGWIRQGYAMDPYALD